MMEFQSLIEKELRPNEAEKAALKKLGLKNDRRPSCITSPVRYGRHFGKKEYRQPHRRRQSGGIRQDNEIENKQRFQDENTDVAGSDRG